MREIEFRGKEIETNEWVYGYYFCMVHANQRHIHHFIIQLRCDLSKDRALRETQFEINPETLGQFTGLYDKNGRKIYEGDIVDHWCNYGVVRFGVHSTDSRDFHERKIYGYYIEGDQHESTLSTRGRIMLKDVEVMGNKYEIP